MLVTLILQAFYAPILSFAPIGEVIGSTLSAAIWAAIASSQMTTQQDAVLAAIQNAAFTFFFGVIISIPTCLFLDAPVIYYLRSRLVRQPFRWSALISMLGLVTGTISFGWLFSQKTDYMFFPVWAICSGSSAFSYAFLYGRRTKIRLVHSKA